MRGKVGRRGANRSWLQNNSLTTFPRDYEPKAIQGFRNNPLGFSGIPACDDMASGNDHNINGRRYPKKFESQNLSTELDFFPNLARVSF